MTRPTFPLGLTIQPSIPTYEVFKVNVSRPYWVLARVDQMAFIGKFPLRKQAVNAGRLLAGFRGTVTIRKGN